jgi:transposase-like protein
VSWDLSANYIKWTKTSQRDKLKIIREGKKDGLTDTQIAKSFDITAGTIKYFWKRYHIDPQQNPKGNDVYLNHLKELGRAGVL